MHAISSLIRFSLKSSAVELNAALPISIQNFASNKDTNLKQVHLWSVTSNSYCKEQVDFINYSLRVKWRHFQKEIIKPQEARLKRKCSLKICTPELTSVQFSPGKISRLDENFCKNPRFFQSKTCYNFASFLFPTFFLLQLATPQKERLNSSL